MELSSEDSLRLHVLLKNVEAIRIDEQALTVHGLAARGEARVALNPNCRPEQYLRRVREFFSGAVLGSPGGYPVHLQRWTRMGQARDSNLADLLMLGEPEAVAAVACAPGLTNELARRAWWVAPTAENARRMLARACVMEGSMGPVLAAFLVEHLPFESEAPVIVETVRLVLQPGLIDSETRRRLWERGAQKNPYRIGFLVAAPHDLPDPHPPRADLAQHRATLTALAGSGNPLAQPLRVALDRPGQTFIAAASAILERIADQDAAVVLLNGLGSYFRPFRFGAGGGRDMQQLAEEAASICGPENADRHPPLAELVRALPALQSEIAALVTLAGVSDAVATEILARTSASGTLLRRKLEPVSGPIERALACLRGTAHG